MRWGCWRRLVGVVDAGGGGGEGPPEGGNCQFVPSSLARVVPTAQSSNQTSCLPCRRRTGGSQWQANKAMVARRVAKAQASSG